MMKHAAIPVLALAAVAVVAGTRSLDRVEAAGGEAPIPGADVTSEPPAAEAARIAAHLATVERELREADVAHLAPARRAARKASLQRLRAYRLRGGFPHNHDFPGRRVPYFVDRHGTRCAMAYLIERSGASDLVERVASTRNNARIRELADDPELAAWLEANGLTVEEAGRIQPSYCQMHPDDPDCRRPGPESELSDLELAAGTSAALLGTAAIVWNLAAGPSDRGGALRGALGLGTGVLGLALGSPVSTTAGPRGPWGWWMRGSESRRWP